MKYISRSPTNKTDTRLNLLCDKLEKELAAEKKIENDILQLNLRIMSDSPYG